MLFDNQDEQPQTFLGKRGETEIQKVTLKQLYTFLRNSIKYYRPDSSDPDAFCQDVCIYIEQIMGIYPNVDPPPPAGAEPEGPT
jgi:hypothetical protein